MVLNTDLKEIMMDHGLRTISYIADIGKLVVIMARRRVLPQVRDEEDPDTSSWFLKAGDDDSVIGTTPKMICHVFESKEVKMCQHMRSSSKCPFPGAVHSPVHRAGLPSGVHGVPQGQWNRGPQLRQGNGLPRGPQLTRDIWGRTSNVCQKRAAERGDSIMTPS